MNRSLFAILMTLTLLQASFYFVKCEKNNAKAESAEEPTGDAYGSDLIRPNGVSMDKIIACMKLMKNYLYDHQDEINKLIKDSPILKKKALSDKFLNENIVFCHDRMNLTEAERVLAINANETSVNEELNYEDLYFYYFKKHHPYFTDKSANITLTNDEGFFSKIIDDQLKKGSTEEEEYRKLQRKENKIFNVDNDSIVNQLLICLFAVIFLLFLGTVCYLLRSNTSESKKKLKNKKKK